MLNELIKEAEALKNKNKIPQYESYLQVRPGGYGEGDVVWAIRVPHLRALSKKHKQLPLNKVFELLSNPVHDLRLLALFILDLQYNNKKTTNEQKKAIVDGYLNNLKYINNWDLVDASCYKIIGPFVLDNNRDDLLIGLAESDNFWENRVAMISTFHHIKQNEFSLALVLAQKLINHPHDIIHKAVGWMLREVGNRDQMEELDFLAKHYKIMPRTMLRYAIEKFDEQLRQAFLQGTF